MKLGVIGAAGMVGGVVARGLESIGHDIVRHDVKLGTSIDSILPCEVAFVCVPTPAGQGGACDVQYVESAVRHLDAVGYAGVVVIKSTVEPGTTDRLKSSSRLRIVSCPEFLREKTADADFMVDHHICAIGSDHHADADLVAQAHGSIPKSFAFMKPLEAELLKYFCNSFNAFRIVFASSFADVCRRVGADYQTIKSAAVMRRNVGDHYLDDLGPFGGSCLPKDTAAFAAFAESVGFGGDLFRTIVRENGRHAGPREAAA